MFVLAAVLSGLFVPPALALPAPEVEAGDAIADATRLCREDSVASSEGAVPSMRLLPGAPRSSSKPTYVCPMHPEVVSDAPGICPKCHMKLAPKTSVEVQPEHRARAADVTPPREATR